MEARLAAERAHADHLAALNRRLVETAEEKRRFVSMVIHDLRHPLTALRTSLYLLRTDTNKKARLTHLDALEQRTRALSNLLDELVLYDQIEAGRSLLRIEPLDPMQLIRDCIAEIAGIEGEAMVPIVCECEPGLGIVHLDGGKLRHILLNLLGNALKYTYQGCVVVRTAVVDEHRWRLEVEDSGVGMTSLEQQRAFEEYFSGAAGMGSGVGLGLAIAHRLCTTLGAEISMRSVPGQGTLFSIAFPRHIGLVDTASHETDCMENRRNSSPELA